MNALDVNTDGEEVVLGIERVIGVAACEAGFADAGLPQQDDFDRDLLGGLGRYGHTINYNTASQ